LGDLLGANAVKGILTFALGGLLLAFAWLFSTLFFTSPPTNSGDIVITLLLAFTGFLFVGIGLWALLQDALASKTK
jgi:hypothetical protein